MTAQPGSARGDGDAVITTLLEEIDELTLRFPDMRAILDMCRPAAEHIDRAAQVWETSTPDDPACDVIRFRKSSAPGGKVSQ